MLNTPISIVAGSDRLTDLSIIGVPDQCQQRIPTATAYPRKFDGRALSIWQSYVETPEFKSWARSQADLDQVWHETIKHFLKLCENEGVVPFANNTDTTRNEFVENAFARSRIMLVHWLNEIKMFERVKVRKAFREYVANDKGILVRSWAELFTVKDLPEFEAWLQQTPTPRFLKYPDNRWTKMVQPHIMVWVKIINSARVIVGYEIKLAGTVNIPGKKTPTKKEVNKFLDSTLWFPIVRAHKIDAIKNRLF